MSTVIHMDCDRGAGSIADLQALGKVVSYDCTTFEKAELVYWGIVNGQIQGDVVVLDTLSQLVNDYVSVCTLDPKEVRPAEGKTWYSLRTKMRTNQDTWNLVNYGIRNLVTGLRNLKIPSIILAHEVERDDPTAEAETDRHMPALPPKILTNLMALSDLVMRLYKAPAPFVMDGAQYPANSRVLQLVNTANAYTGVRLTPEKDAALPAYIPEPTLGKLASAIGYLPRAMTIYGFPKVGKTVFACTLPI